MTDIDTDSVTNKDKPKEVATACGAWIELAENTPSVIYRNETIFFCSPDCKDLYDEDPLNSCMAGRILMDRR